jgi:hypothetical protein
MHVPLPAEAGAVAGLGSVLPIASLFGGPTMIVWSVPDVPAMDVLEVVIVRMQLPGVLVEVRVNATVPAAAVPLPLPAEKLVPVPVGTAVMLQTFAELESRDAVRTVEVSLMTAFPLASWITTVYVEVDTVSAAIGLRLKDPAVFVAAPGAVVATIALQPVRLPEVPETETWALPVAVVVVAVTDAVPLDGVTGFVQPAVMRVGVTFVKLSVGVLALVTVLPFASFNVAMKTMVLLPFATVVVGVAEHAICDAGPKTVTGATAVRPSELEATTLHGCVAEFVAVAAKRPALVIAPQPPVTDQLMVAPAEAPLAVNCCVPPTGSEADDGVSVRPPPAPGVLFWVK